MKPPRRVEDARERLDGPIPDPAVHEASLDHLRAINRWLGGEPVLRRAVAPFCRPGAHLACVDVGCGGADLAIALARFARRRGARTSVFAIDRGLSAIRLAKARSRHERDVHVFCADANFLPLADRSADLAVMTLTLHHFDGEHRIAVLRELARVARALVVINDLERTWANYLGARLLAATLWRGNGYTRHDAPLSVLRGFTGAELRIDLERAGLVDVRVRRRFFYRLLGTGAPPLSDAAARTL